MKNKGLLYSLGIILAGSALVAFTIPAEAYPTTVPNHNTVINIDDEKGSIDHQYDYTVKIMDHTMIYEYEGEEKYQYGMPMIFDLNTIDYTDHLISFLGALNNPETTVKIEVAGVGGMTYTMYRLYEAIKKSPADVTMHVVGHVASAHAVVAIAGDRIIVEDNVKFMFHMPLYIVPEKEEQPDGTMKEVQKRYYMCRPGATTPYKWMEKNAKYTCSEAREFYDYHVKHLLTETQYYNLTQGIDVWVNGQQVQDKFKENFAQGWEYKPHVYDDSVLI